MSLIFYWVAKMDSPTALKNILLIRSATRILHPTIESLKNEFPGSKITVLAPESTREVLEKHPIAIRFCIP